MKKLLAVIAANVLIAGVVAISALSTASCASLSTQAQRDKAIYQTLGALNITADTAMNIYGDWVRAGHPEKNDQVKSLFAKYQDGMDKLEGVIRAYRAGTVAFETVNLEFSKAITNVEALSVATKATTGKAVPKGTYKVGHGSS